MAKFNQIPSPQEFSIKYSLILTHRGFLEFELPNHSESGYVSMEEVVHLSEIFKTIFFQIFGARKDQFWIGQSLNNFEFQI